MHNQNDEGFVKIMRGLIPALEQCRSGTPVLINETILPERGEMTPVEEHELRRMDLAMLVVLGAKQRTEKEFRELVKRADPRFEVVKVRRDAVGSMGLLQVHFNKGDRQGQADGNLSFK